MAIIYSYPTVDPVREDLILGTDVSSSNKATKNFTIQSIIDLVTVATGDLQTVLALGNVATGFDIDLTNSSFIGGGFRTTGGIVISGTTGIGFTNLTSTAFTGTIATATQPNITSLGALTALVLDGPISGTNLITSSNLTGAANDNVVSTLAIKTYVDNQVGLFDTLAEVLANGNTTGGTSIVVSAADNITFTDTSKALFGNSQDLEINNDGIDSFITDLSTGDLRLRSDNAVKIQASTGGNTLATFTKGAGVDLYFNNDKKLETLVGGAKVTGAFEATTTGTFIGLLNTGTYTATNGIGTAGQILSSTGTGTSWVTEVPLYNWSLEGTTIPSGTAVTITDGANITTTWDAGTFDLTIATTGVPDGSGAANQVTFWSDADTLTSAAGFIFAGGATGQVTVAGTLQAGTLSDGTFSGTAGTYTGGVSIESTTFVGALTGNADTATALAAPGTISIDGDFTTTIAPTYTSGGSETITANIADTVVTAKILTNLATPTSAAISAGDTILAAMAKLQGQITGLAGSLAFEGTWDASTGNPPSATPLNGQFWIVSVAGNTNLDGITDWLVGDWAIYVNNGAGTDAWQKLDQSNEVLGSGAANKIAKWTSTNTLATGLIDDDGTLVTIGNSGSLLVEGSTTLGDATTDTVTATGPVTLNKTLNIVEGIEVNGGAGTAGQVLTSGAGSGTVMSWTTPTTGVVESISGGAGITISGTSAIPVVSVDYLGADNIILSAGTAVTPVGADTIMISDASDSGNVVKALISGLPFDAYSSWTADSDEGTDITVTSGFNLKFTGAVTAGGAGIATDSAVSANEMTIGLINAGGTPGATTFYRGDGQWSVPVGTKTETLEEVLGNGNTSGANDIVMADSQKITFGASGDLEITHDTSNSYINTTSGSAGDLFIDSQGSGHDLYLQAADDVFIRPQGGQDGIKVIGNQGLELYGYNLSTSAMNKVFYTDDLGSGFPRAIAEKGLRIFNAGSSYGALEYYTEGAGNNRGGMQINGANQSTSNRIFVGDGYIQGTTSGSPGFGLLPVVEFFYSNPTTTIAKYQFSTSRAFIGSSAGNVDLKITGDTEITGDLTVDGDIIHGGGNSGTFTGSKSFTGGAASVILFRLFRPTTGALVFDVYLTSGTSGYACKKYTVAHRLNTTPNYNKIIDSGAAANGDYVVTFANDGQSIGGDAISCSIAATTTQDIYYTVQVGQGATAVTRYTS